jgi:hypothetical protein
MEEMGMDETQMILALRALRELLDNGDRDDEDELVASYRALGKAIVKNKLMTRKDRTRVAKYLREAGARDGATPQTGIHAVADQWKVASSCFTNGDRNGYAAAGKAALRLSIGAGAPQETGRQNAIGRSTSARSAEGLMTGSAP